MFPNMFLPVWMARAVFWHHPNVQVLNMFENSVQEHQEQTIRMQPLGLSELLKSPERIHLQESSLTESGIWLGRLFHTPTRNK